MGPETHIPAARTNDGGSRCPHCAGAVRPEAAWCTQCWADLRPTPEPVKLATAPAAAFAPPVGGAQVPSVGRGLGGWPCSGCGTVNAVEVNACVACGTGFLAGLRQNEPPLLALPGIGDVTRLSRAQRLALAGAVVLVMVVLVVMLSLVTG